MGKVIRQKMNKKTKDLIERFQTLYLIKIGEAIDYSEAEYHLKQLAELVRLTSKAEVIK